MAHESRNRGKGVEQTTPWSDWIWDNSRGYFYAHRIGPSGETEYDTRYPDTAQTHNIQYQTPRFGGTDVTGHSAAHTGQPFGSGASSSLSTGQNSNAFSATTTSYAPVSNYTPTTEANPSLHYTITPSSPQASSALPYKVSYARFDNTNPKQSEFSSSTNTNSYRAESLSPSFSNLQISPPLITRQLSNQNQPLPGEYFAEGGSSSTPNVARRNSNTGRSLSRTRLDSRYQPVPENQQRTFWKLGRVFMTAWIEPASSQHSGPRGGSNISKIWREDVYAFAEIRRFVVVRANHGNSFCSPIHTYGGKATFKPNLPETKKHAIIYTTPECPPEKSYEAVDGTVVFEDLTYEPIRVISELSGREGVLEPESRLNYSKIYTVEHYARVLNIGMVHQDSLQSVRLNCALAEHSVEGPVKRPPPRDPGGWSSGGQKSRSQGQGQGQKKQHRDKKRNG